MFSCIGFALFITVSQGQSEHTRDLTLGLGYGLDQGGIGLKPSVARFSDQFELTVGLGYNFNLVGINGGLLVRTSPQNSVAVYFSPMYGYVGVIKGSPFGSQNATTYYGASFSTGIELRGSKHKNYFTLDFIIPIRPQSFKDDIIKYSADKPWPVLPSIGYHMVL